MATQGGPAKPVTVQTGGRVQGGPAQPIAIVTDGRAVEGGPSTPIVIVTSGPVLGGPAMPVVAASAGRAVRGGPAIPAYIVSGSFSSIFAYTNKVIATGPIAYWPQADAAGATVMLDESGNGRNGAYTAVTLGQPGIGDGRTSASFDGSTSFGNLFSNSLQSAFNNQEGTVALWMKVSSAGVWTDAAQRRCIRLAVDANNSVVIFKATTNNQLSWTYQAGGTSTTRSKTSVSSVDWVHLALTWSKSNDQAISYYNGVQEGATLTGLGVWAGSLASSTTLLGATSQTPGGVWSGTAAHVALWGSVLSAAQIASLASVS